MTREFKEKPKDQLFYVGQKVFINKDGKVLVLFVPKSYLAGVSKSHLDFPGGKIQQGESDFKKALKREVQEEIGLKIKIGDPFVNWFIKLGKDHREAGKKIYLIGFKCKYASGKVRLSDAHNKFKWVDKNNYKELDDGSDYFKALAKYFVLQFKRK